MTTHHNRTIVILMVLAIVVVTVVLLILSLTRTKGGGDGTDTGLFGDTSATRSYTPPTTSPMNPFGTVGTSSTLEAPSGPAPFFRLVTPKPVIGATIVGKDTGGVAEDVRYVERDTGMVWDTTLAYLNTPEVVSQRTIQRIGEVAWAGNGAAMLARFTDRADGQVVYGFAGRFAVSTSSDPASGAIVRSPTLEGAMLPINVITAALSPDGSTLFYIVPTEAGSVGYVEPVGGGTRTEVWTSPLRSVTALWGIAPDIYVYTKPTSHGNGFLWDVDPTRRTSSILLGEQRGLSVRPAPGGAKILYSFYDAEGILTLRVLTVATGEVTYLPMPTHTEKCAWGPSARYVYCAIPKRTLPDDFLERWYQGAYRTDDTVWRFDTDTGASDQLIDPAKATARQLDIVDPVIGPTESYLVFRGRTDDSLWALELPRE